MFRIFPRNEINRRKGDVGGRPGAHTMWWRGQGARAALWCGHPSGPLRVSFGLRVRDGKIGTSGFVSSNSENISRTTFLKPRKSWQLSKTATMVK